MGKCPYCSKELHIGDFFETSSITTSKGGTTIAVENFKGEQTSPMHYIKMWVCPSCDTIIGFSEWFAQ